MLITHYFGNPTINAVKSDILKLNVHIIKTTATHFVFFRKLRIETEGEDAINAESRTDNLIIAPHRIWSECF